MNKIFIISGTILTTILFLIIAIFFSIQNNKVGTNPFPVGNPATWKTSGSNIYRNTGNVGVGTNTPAYTLDVYGNLRVDGNSYLTDLAIAAGTFIAIDNTGKIIATSTPSSGDLSLYVPYTGATSDLNLGSNDLTVSGTTTASGAFVLSNSASPVLDTQGEMAIDTTSGQLRYNDGTLERVLKPTYDKSMGNVASTTIDVSLNSFDTGTTTWRLMNPDGGVKLEKIYCKTDQGTIIVRAGDGTNWSEDIVCSSAGAEDESLSNNTFTDRENFIVQIGSQSGDPGWVLPTFTFSDIAD